VSYYGALQRGVGFGDASAPTPSDVLGYAGGASFAVPSVPAVPNYSLQGQQLYTQANQIAATANNQAQQALAQGQAVAAQGQALVANATKGDLTSVVSATTLLANNISAGTAQSAMASSFQSFYASTGAALTAVASILVLTGEISAAAALAFPVVGAMVAACVLLTVAVLSKYGASSPTEATPPVVQALINVAIPSKAQAVAGDPPMLDPTATLTCSGSSIGTVTESGGQMLAQWRDDLEFAAAGSVAAGNAAMTAAQNNRGLATYFAPTGADTYQTRANDVAACMALSMGGQPIANAAIGLAARWVPLGDAQQAPYSAGFSALGAGANGAGATLEDNLVALAFTLAQWPPAQADTIALQYLTQLAWVWDNFPGNSAPLPGWIAYKLGWLQSLVASEAPAPTSAVSTARVVAASTAGVIAAGAAGIAIYAFATGGTFMGVARGLFAKVGLTRL
jgi:hypothetical protein